MRTMARFVTFALCVIGAVDVVTLNILVSLYHTMQRRTGADPS